MRKNNEIDKVPGLRMGGRPAKLVACHDCDLLQREIPLGPGCAARCSRCGATVYRNATDSINRTLAYTLAAAVLFVIANVCPIFAIRLRGSLSSITLLGAIVSLWNQKMESISAVVFLTAFLVPVVEITLKIYLLLPLNCGCVPAGHKVLMRTLWHIRPWGMVEVFMLGVLVSLVKLMNSITVIPGMALWAFGTFMLIMTAAAASFSSREVWSRVDSISSERVRK